MAGYKLACGHIERVYMGRRGVGACKLCNTQPQQLPLILEDSPHIQYPWSHSILLRLTFHFLIQVMDGDPLTHMDHSTESAPNPGQKAIM